MLHFTRWKTIAIWLTVLAGVLFAAPNLVSQSTLDSLPNWLPKKQMTLGLDLQGGSHILLQLDRNDLVQERLETVRNDIRSMLREARVGYTGLSGTGNSVQVRVRDAGDLDKARTALEQITAPVASGVFGGSITEVEMQEPEPGLLRFTLTDAGITYRMSSALSQSIEVVNRRVNELGTTELAEAETYMEHPLRLVAHLIMSSPQYQLA